MAHKITDECISCGTCASECPVDAISEGAAHYEINADACLDCGACAGVCPTGAIIED
ncbi:MAG: 4Fe-4S binding protein [Acetivibrio sp.]